jgi:hypothetical protein
MLLDALLDDIAKLDTELDLSTIRTQMVGLVPPKTKVGTATRFSNYEMAIDTLQKDLSCLNEVKMLVAEVLGTFEDPDFEYSKQSQFESVINNLNNVVNRLVLLAGK